MKFSKNKLLKKTPRIYNKKKRKKAEAKVLLIKFKIKELMYKK
jgi:hypothetical protein